MAGITGNPIIYILTASPSNARAKESNLEPLDNESSDKWLGHSNRCPEVPGSIPG